MIESILKFIKREARILLLVVLVIGLLLAVNADGAFTYFLAQGAIFTIVSALLTQLTRRILFPYVDMKRLIAEMKGDPISKAIVFASVSFVVATLILVSAIATAFGK